MEYSERLIEALPLNHIFVFGSNLAGRHGAGGALTALKRFGAIYGQGVGLQGASYAIPTKDQHIQTLPLKRIEMYICKFIEFAKSRQDLTFHLTEIGCGLAGYKPKDIAPLFKGIPNNVLIPITFARYL